MPGFKAGFPSVPSSLPEVRDLVKKFAYDQGLSENQVIDVVIAVGEACSNAVLYAATDRGYWVSCNFEDPVLTIQVHDFGNGFSLAGKGRYIEPEFRKSGGLGIYIMRVLMDETTYHMDEEGTTVSLVKLARSSAE